MLLKESNFDLDTISSITIRLYHTIMPFGPNLKMNGHLKSYTHKKRDNDKKVP